MAEGNPPCCFCLFLARFALSLICKVDPRCAWHVGAVVSRKTGSGLFVCFSVFALYVILSKTGSGLFVCFRRLCHFVQNGIWFICLFSSPMSFCTKRDLVYICLFVFAVYVILSKTGSGLFVCFRRLCYFVQNGIWFFFCFFVCFRPLRRFVQNGIWFICLSVFAVYVILSKTGSGSFVCLSVFVVYVILSKTGSGLFVCFLPSVILSKTGSGLFIYLSVFAVYVILSKTGSGLFVCLFVFTVYVILSKTGSGLFACFRLLSFCPKRDLVCLSVCLFSPFTSVCPKRDLFSPSMSFCTKRDLVYLSVCLFLPSMSFCPKRDLVCLSVCLISSSMSFCPKRDLVCLSVCLISSSMSFCPKRDLVCLSVYFRRVCHFVQHGIWFVCLSVFAVYVTLSMSSCVVSLPSSPPRWPSGQGVRPQSGRPGGFLLLFFFFFSLVVLFCFVFFVLFWCFFSFPSYISGVHHFWVRFLRM